MKTQDNIKVRQSPDDYETLLKKLGRPWDDIYLQRLDAVLKPEGKTGIMLDVGIGTGLIVREMARMPLYSGYKFIGLDYYDDMVETCTELVKEEGLEGKIEVVQGDAYQMDFPDNYFDVVMSRATIHHLSDPTEALREKYRVLKPGGVCLIHDIRRDAPEEVLEQFTKFRAQLNMPPTIIEEKFTMPEMRSFIERAGLKDIAYLATAESGVGALGFEVYFSK
ncbi:class I SAM-dependent methyltransferase [Chitinophagaceae bacterium MMS25-I14]